jgi:hypothetical protein
MPAIQQIVNPLPVLEQSLQVTRAVHYPNQGCGDAAFGARERTWKGSWRGRRVYSALLGK